MKIELNKIKVRDLVEGYENNNENGVKGYWGKLDIRPPYQREFVYKDKQRDEVVRTVKKGFPLNIMYWIKNSDSSFEVLDGQQRTISLCSYIKNDYSIDFKFFHNLDDDSKNEILDYELSVYICEGTDKEKLDWFRIVNIAGEKLTDQELRNSVYVGPWLSDAKRHFSKTKCVAYELGSSYLTGTPIKQDYLETVLKWVINRDDLDNIEDYMSIHQHDKDADDLWQYYQEVIAWIKKIFPNYRSKLMKGIDWGKLYNEYKQDYFNSNELENEIKKLLLDDDVTKKKGICPYLITKNKKYLNLRQFSDAMKLKSYELQDGICVKCEEHFELNEMEADHIIPWSKGGKTKQENCQLLCENCNRTKSNN